MARATATTSPEAAAEPRAILRAATDYLGPARVTEVAGGAITAALPDGTAVRARMALAFPYRPAPGDSLLLVGRDGAFYVIGVLQGAGETVLSFAGGVEVRAEGGPLRLTSDQAVELCAPEVSVDAGSVRIFAEAAVEKLGTLYRHVRGLFRARAGESETLVDGSALTRAKSATILTDEHTTINGKQIHLG